MNAKKRTGMAQSCLLTVALLSMATTLSAAAILPSSLNARIVPRPVTPGDVTTYGLPAGIEVSGGLGTFATGTPAYLEVEVTISNVYASTITNITWTLTPPIGSSAALAASPLTANVPVFLPSDRLVYQVSPVKGRMLLRPDLVGDYTVNAAIGATGGTTNVSATFTVATYLGLSLRHPWDTGNISGLGGHGSRKHLHRRH